jgi:hypothetical protein
MTDRDKEGRDVLLGRIEPAWQGHTDLGAQIQELIETVQRLQELIKEQTQTIVSLGDRKR